MRILMSLVLALSFSFACDKPYEEAEGFKIGCPLEDTAGYQVATEEFNGSPVVIYSKWDEQGKTTISPNFNFVSLITVDNVIENVFLTNFNRPTEEDFLNVLGRLTQRWGVYLDFPKPSNKTYFWEPADGLISQIALRYDAINISGDGAAPTYIVLSFTTKKGQEVSDYLADQQEQRDAKAGAE